MCDYSRGGRISPSEIRKCGPRIWKRCTLRRAKNFIVRTFKKYSPRGTNGLTRKQFYAFANVMWRVNRLSCSRQRFPGGRSSRYTYSARAWKMCDYSKGGIVSKSEWRRCSTRLMKRCNLKRFGRWINNQFKRGGMNKAKFDRFYRSIARLNRYRCRRVVSKYRYSARAWKMCDYSKGGIVSKGEWRKCSTRLMKRCNLKRFGRWINNQFKRGGMNKAKFDRFYRSIARLNRYRCRRVVSKYRYSARAWKMCDYSKGGIVSKGEWRKCSTRLMKRCNLKRFGRWINNQFRRGGMNKAKFDRFYRSIARLNRYRCRRVVSKYRYSARAWKMCDYSRGGIVSKGEWRKCSTRLVKRCNLKRYGRWIASQFKRGGMNKAKFHRFYLTMVRLNRHRCRKVNRYRYSARAWKMCDYSRGGIVSKSEFRKCSTRLFKRCNLKRYASWINRSFRSGMNKAKFDRFYRYMVRLNRHRCRKVVNKYRYSARAWKLCDRSKGGIVSKGEFNWCKYRLFKRCNLKRYAGWINRYFKRSMTKARFHNFYRTMVRLNRHRCRKVNKYRYSARAWKMCDYSKGGIISRSEWRKCSTRLMKRCNLKRFGSWISRQFKRSMTKARFHSFYRSIVRLNRYRCRKTNKYRYSARAWKMCDYSKGGIISRSEWKKCSTRLFKRCNLKRYARWISRQFKRSMTKGRFHSFYRTMVRVNRHRCRKVNKYRYSARAWKMCDYSKGGIVSKSEWRKCSTRIMKRCNLKRFGRWINKQFKRGGMSKAKFDRFYRSIARLNRYRCRKTNKYGWSARAWKMCDYSKGGIVSKGEWRKCSTRLMKRCNLKRFGRWINKQFKRGGMNKSKFHRFYKTIWRLNRYRCRKVRLTAAQRAFKLCDRSKGGIVSRKEWNWCKYRLFKRTTLRKYGKWIY
jgi:hypothetical protein